MNATLLYRIAAVLLILFAVGHTFGSLLAPPPTPEAAALRHAMNQVFEVKGKSYSYGRFYTGLAASITVYLVFMAFLAWRLGSVAARTPEAIGALGWIFCASQLATLVLAAIYIAAAPAISAGVVGACLGLAAWKTQTNKADAVSLTSAASLG